MTFIILPAYNEEKGLGKLLKKIKETMNKDNYQVVLVNDGSTDRTEDVANSLSDFLPLKIVRHQKNRGLGETIKSGFGEISGILNPEDIVITMDADNTHPPELIPQMVEKIAKNYDLVIASRFCVGGKEIGLTFMRRMFSRGACLILRTLFPFPPVKDYTSGYRAYSGRLLNQAIQFYGEELIGERGFTVTAGVLLRLTKLKPMTAEIPMVLRYDLKEGESKIKILPTIFQYFSLIVKNF